MMLGLIENRRRPMNEFEKQVVLVTGGGSGIGQATALLFAREGAYTVLLDCDVASGSETQSMISREGGKALFLNTDVSDPAQVKSAIAETIAQFGRIDLLVANAAVQMIRPVEETSDEEWTRQLEVNLTGTFLCCREAIIAMRRQQAGCIVIVSSGHAFQSYAGYSGYAATKGGQLAFMRAAAIDCAKDGIRVNCIIPGATDTALIREHFEKTPGDEARLLKKIPLGRLASPSEIARSIRLLASRDAAYITGTSLVVDGGLLAQG
jgi:2-keto-3-deoxy-L-fuconate dehydrogenase